MTLLTFACRSNQLKNKCRYRCSSYEVVCTAPTAPTLTAVTSATSWRFHPVELGTLYRCSTKLLYDGKESTSSQPTRVQVQDGQGALAVVREFTNLNVCSVEIKVAGANLKPNCLMKIAMSCEKQY